MRYCNPTSGGLIRGPGGVLDILMHLTSCACQNCLGSGSPARGADGPSCTASVTACVTSKEDPRVVVCAAQRYVELPALRRGRREGWQWRPVPDARSYSRGHWEPERGARVHGGSNQRAGLTCGAATHPSFT